ncbi:pseudouridylate synthase TRUB1-like isoform X2 [Panulirus ornatus]|uniref:pseudouridylate synthase TRUB1-like isoform X2 n=1 Tax=Panulirus ornatus TaxID=150431 RepID=UPI003A84CC97
MPVRKGLQLGMLTTWLDQQHEEYLENSQCCGPLYSTVCQELSGTITTQDIKIGHGGTLDTTATGVLTVGVGDGCSKLKCFLHGEKSYLARCQLGIATDTYNETGRIIMEKEFGHVTKDILQESLHQFQGRIKQTPPIFSALKRKGRRYSDLARDGVDFDIGPRVVHCYELKLLDFEPPNFTMTIVSGPGFYVRSLIHDLGQAVGSCAHLSGLQRTRQGPFTLHHSLHEDEWRLENVINNIARFRKKIDKYYKSYESNKRYDRW